MKCKHQISMYVYRDRVYRTEDGTQQHDCDMRICVKCGVTTNECDVRSKPLPPKIFTPLM